MTAPTTPLPPDPRPAVDERSTLDDFLEFYRTVFLRKAEGLTDDEARRATCPPSDLTVLGLVRHMAEVERAWFRRRLVEEMDYIFDYTDDEDADLHPPPDATLADAIAQWHAEVDIARSNAATVGLGDMLTSGRTPLKSVRWVYVHMIEEYARHCGHLDLIRQALDGQTGD